MRVNEVLSRCRTNQSVIIHYDNRCIVGYLHNIIDLEEYRLNRVGDMLITRIGTSKDSLLVKAVKV